MNSETKVCQNCKKDFVIEPDDFAFYEKIKVPAPTFCSECRMMRRLLWRQHRTVYKRPCMMCGIETFGIYHPSVEMNIFCSECWRSDKWDSRDYGIEVDFLRPFLDQMFELRKKVPAESSYTLNSINCRYCIVVIDSKDCYFCFGSINSKSCLYCFAPFLSFNCIDSDVGRNMDSAYGCYNSSSIFRTQYVYFSEECISSSFLFNCIGCSDCFGCINLKSKKYHIFNEPFTQEEYKQKIKYWDMGSYAKVKEAEEKFNEIYYATPHKYAHIINSPDSVGDNIIGGKNCKQCFMALFGVENCKYILSSGLLLRDSQDVSFGGSNSQLMYETSGTEESKSIFFSRGGKVCSDVQYSENCTNSSNLFGCFQMRNRSYCILNKQYKKEEYEVLVPKIIEHMNKMPYISPRGIVYKYGEYFLIEFPPWKYNEAYAFDFIPLSRKEAVDQGFGWREEKQKGYVITKKVSELPDHIKDVSDSITQEIIECAHAESECDELCSKAFRIVSDELEYYRKMNIALPRLCPNCRYSQRKRFKTTPKLYHRTCMKSSCKNEFETAYSYDRKEIIYCDTCYKVDFL